MSAKKFAINGNKIREYRLLKELTQIDLAFEAKISESVLNKIEKGKHTNIRLQTLMNICAVLECDPKEITSFI